MRAKEVLRIGMQIVRAHRKRSWMIMAVTGVIFGLMLAMNAWLQGVENNYIRWSGQASDGKVIVAIDNEQQQMTTAIETTFATREEMLADVRAWGGEILEGVQGDDGYESYSLPIELVQGAVERDLAEVPDDAVPVLVPVYLGKTWAGEAFAGTYATETQKVQAYEEYRKTLIGKVWEDWRGTKYYVVGLAPGGFHINNLSFRQLSAKNEDVLNPLLEMIPVNGGTLIVLGESATAETNVESRAVAVFDDAESAYAFLEGSKARFANLDATGKTYDAWTIVGTDPQVLFILRMMRKVVYMISGILMIVALIVVIFTSIRLVDQDAHNITLYYSLGATKRQVREIFGGYFAIVALGALIFAFVMSGVAVLGFSVVNQNLLSAQAMLSFSLMARPRVIWYGVNWATLVIALVVLLTAPLGVLVNRQRIDKANGVKRTKK